MYKEYYFFLILCCLCHITRTIYEILKYKGIINGDKGFLFTLIIFNMVGLISSWLKMSKIDPYKIAINNLIKYTGIFIFISGLLLFILTIIKLKGFSDKGLLKKNGIYSKIRHPMYYGVILWMTGVSIYNGSVMTISISIIFILNILLWRGLEEKVLERRYEGYREYKKSTWF